MTTRYEMIKLFLTEPESGTDNNGPGFATLKKAEKEIRHTGCFITV